MAPGRELGAFLLALLAFCGGRRLAEAAGGPGGRRGAAADACGGRVSSAGLGPAAAVLPGALRGRPKFCGAGGGGAAPRGRGAAEPAVRLLRGSAPGPRRSREGRGAGFLLRPCRGRAGSRVIDVLLRGFAFYSCFCCVLLSDSSLLSFSFPFFLPLKKF